MYWRVPKRPSARTYPSKAAVGRTAAGNATRGAELVAAAVIHAQVVGVHVVADDDVTRGPTDDLPVLADRPPAGTARTAICARAARLGHAGSRSAPGPEVARRDGDVVVGAQHEVAVGQGEGRRHGSGTPSSRAFDRVPTGNGPSVRKRCLLTTAAP